MAIVASLPQEGAETQIYNIPDAELEKYKVNKVPLTPEKMADMFPGKQALGREDAQGVMPAAMLGGDVQPYCYYVCWVVYTDGSYVWWCC